MWVRGGKAFGAIPRNYGGTIPKKMRRAALCSALSSRAKDEKVLVIDRLTVEEPKTKLVNSVLNSLSILNKKNNQSESTILGILGTFDILGISHLGIFFLILAFCVGYRG